MSLNIIGISAHFHDAACCLLRDGKLVAAVQEERFSRIKHDPTIPRAAFGYCLEQGGITIADVDCVAYYEDPVVKLDRQLWMGLPQLPSLAPEALFRLDPARAEREIRELLGFEGEIQLVPHHLSHAASSFCFSGFDDAAILVVDAVGEWATTSLGRASGSSLEILDEVRFPDSLGLLYSTITSYLGFEVNDAEYKVMGLAPYGQPIYLDKLMQLVESLPNGKFRLNPEYFDFMRGRRMYSEALCDLLGAPPRAAESEIPQFAKDVARSLQVLLEKLLLQLANHLHRIVPSQNLCMAGGVALNCVANAAVLRDGPFDRLFVQPAAGDAGGALGAAAMAHITRSGQRPEVGRLEHVYLGPRYSSNEVAALLEATPLAFADFRGRERELLATVADRLADGKVIGWFHGGMEFGPRALGARSIIADPRRDEMRDRINALVKMREAFRPFAPAVLAEAASAHFDLDHPSPFMLETCQVKSAIRLPAITHVDGSARVQTVDAKVSPRFHALISEFGRRTGCPILLNTSFNLRGEPIVCSPMDALLCFLRSDIDFLVLEDFVIDRAGVPGAWTGWYRSTGQSARAISDIVYTLF
ncbi:MAG TPA: carbamoyltransferase N-terminal domain-containing protein [Kofleriaceae bacterium]|jgi:carbamoyltransferase|nr:carbamoyltransferase N-terminal domain-containing protein [Kofleriaceae bacterium]